MHRPPYEYSSPLNNYFNSNLNHEFDANYGQVANEVYADSRYTTQSYSSPHNVQRPDLYEGNNDNTLRAEERNWYIENHRSNHHSPRVHETLPRTSKEQRKEEDKKQEIETTDNEVTRRVGTANRLRRKEDRCSCECWPTGSPEMTMNGDQKAVPQSAVDMVASYGVYQNPHDDDEQAGFVRITNRGYPYQNQQQGVVVNESGNSTVVPRGTEINNTQRKSFMQKCCGFLGNPNPTPAPSGQEDDCWITCCKPAIFLFLLVLMVVVFALVSGLLVYYNCKYIFF